MSQSLTHPFPLSRTRLILSGRGQYIRNRWVGVCYRKLLKSGEPPVRPGPPDPTVGGHRTPTGYPRSRCTPSRGPTDWPDPRRKYATTPFRGSGQWNNYRVTGSGRSSPHFCMKWRTVLTGGSVQRQPPSPVLTPEQSLEGRNVDLSFLLLYLGWECAKSQTRPPVQLLTYPWYGRGTGW